MFAVENELELIRQIRSNAYQSLQKLMKFMQLAIYPLLLSSLFSLSEAFCVAILRLYYGELFILKSDYTLFLVTCVFFSLVAYYQSYIGENMTKEVRVL